MRTIHKLVRYIDYKTRQDISTHDTAIQADDAWRKGGQREDERVILQTLRDDGTVAYEQTLLQVKQVEKNVTLIIVTEPSTPRLI